MLVTTQTGRVRVIQNGALLTTPALELGARVCTNSERGLLGVAVDPAFALNRHVYLYYTANALALRQPDLALHALRRERDRPGLRARARRPDPLDGRKPQRGRHPLREGRASSTRASATEAATTPLPFGCGGANDAAREQHTLLGKILRIAPDGSIPATNPFQGAGTARCNVTGQTTAGDDLPGDVRVGASQPVPPRLRPERVRHPLLRQRRRPGRLGGGRSRSARRRLRLERARGPLPKRLDERLRRRPPPA